MIFRTLNSERTHFLQGTGNRLALSILALMVHGALQAAQAAEQNSDKDLVVYGSGGTAGDEQQDYAVQTSRAGSKLLLAPRDIPQSVSVITRQRMEDQNLTSVGDVLKNATGISSVSYDSERTDFFSRGFEITNFSYDDIPTTINSTWNFGDAIGDTAIYDRIEVVRGATGLMSGSGEPGAAINLVRKQAVSKTFTGNVSASYGSWNDQRYVADVSTPLNGDGSVRGRVVTGYQDQDSWLHRYNKINKFLYGVVNADLGESTTLGLAWDYQNNSSDNPTWGGNPSLYSNGERTRYRRSLNSSADWSRYNSESRKLIATLTHDWDNGWTFRFNGTRGEQTLHDRLLYISGAPDQETGEGIYGFGSTDKGKRTVNSLDAYTSGPFALFGRQHQLMAGASYGRQHNATQSRDPDDGDNPQITVFNDRWNGHVPQPGWGEWYSNANDVVRQKSVYSAARFSLADPLALIIGARYTQYRTDGSSGEMRKYNTSPYGGLVYDINETLSAYASYTTIFAPQTRRDEQGGWLSPIKGKSYESGLKGDWNDGRLTAALAVFRIEQDNAAESVSGVFVNGTSEQAYRATSGAVSRGAELEVNGAVTDNLQLTFSATRYVARDSSGRYSSLAPQTQLKLFSSYQLPALPDLTVGGGAYWQNRVYQDVTTASGETKRLYQGSYPLVDLFARYRLTRQLTVQANISNLFDRKYYAYMEDTSVYGAPRSASVMMNYSF